ncbi:MAG: peptide deformylase [Ignavibacteriaceae bacterium]
MALLPITLYGDKILRKKVEKVSEVNIKIIELIKNMFDTMSNASGIGLAANQVGADKSIFIVDISAVEGYESYKPMTFINPKIIFYSDEKTVIEEGCLSIPEIRADVERSKFIKIIFQDTDLIEHTIEADELLARVIQHEFDHLQGVLFTDKIDEKIKKKFHNDLNKIKKRAVEIDYPITESIDYQLK